MATSPKVQCRKLPKGFAADIRKIEQRVAPAAVNPWLSRKKQVKKCVNYFWPLANGREWCLLPLRNDQEELA